MKTVTEQVFSSRSEAANLPRLAGKIVREMPAAVGLAFTLARRDFRLRYQQNLLGVVWALLSPLVYALIFVVIRYGMRNQGMRIDTGAVPAGLFALTGIVLFQAWMEGLLNQLQVLRANRSIIQTFNAPPETWFFSALFMSMFGLVFRVAVILGAVAYYWQPLPMSALWFPPLAVAVVLSGNVIGLILSPVASLYRDVRDSVQAISLGLVLCSPVFYPPTTDPESILYTLNMINPFAGIAATTRDALVGGDFVLLSAAVFWLSFTAVAIGVMFMIQRIVFRILAERIT